MKLDQWNLSAEQAEQLLQMAAKKLGTTPETLKKQIESGKFDALLQTPQAKSLIENLTKR